MAPPSPLRAVGVTDSCCSRPEAGSGERTDGQRAHAVPAPLPHLPGGEGQSGFPQLQCASAEPAAVAPAAATSPWRGCASATWHPSCAHSWLTRQNSRGGSGWPRVSFAQHLREGRTSKASPPERSKELFRHPPPPLHTLQILSQPHLCHSQAPPLSEIGWF